MLPKEWEAITLGDCQIKTRSIDPRSKPNDEFDLFSVPSYSTYTPDRVRGTEVGSTKQVVAPGDVLLCKIVPHIRRAWVVPPSHDRQQIASNEWIVFRNHPLEPAFLQRFVLSDEFHEQFMLTVSGVGGSLMRARPIDAAKISIPVPPQAEQRRIVAKLDALITRLARARAELDRVPTLSENLKGAALREAFDGSLTKAWRDANPVAVVVGPRAPEEIRAKFRSVQSGSTPYELPTSWTWLRLPEIGDLDRGKSKHRPRNDPRLFGGKNPFIQTGDVRSARQYLSEYSSTYSDFGLAQSREWPIGTVCITIAANIAESCILAIPACFPDSVVGFRADDDKAIAEYVEYFIRTAKADLGRFAPATAQKNINLETLASVAVPVPPVEEQREIVARLRIAFARADRLEAEAARARALIDRLESAILAKAFRGGLLPQDLSDEPAKLLVERIRSQRAAAPKSKRGRSVASASTA